MSSKSVAFSMYCYYNVIMCMLTICCLLLVQNLLIAIDKKLQLLIGKVDNLEEKIQKLEEVPSSSKVNISI